MSQITYALSTRRYHDWSVADKENIQGFLREHGIDPSRVSITDGEIVVREHSGMFGTTNELSVWVQTDGRERCPHCPSCVKQVEVTTELRREPPVHPFAYMRVRDA